jgi:hypothetical protein
MASEGWLVSPTFGAAARTDLLVQHTDPEVALPAAVQVKTRTRGDFNLDIHDGSPAGANEWVVLVSLPEQGGHPGFCVVPRNHVVAVVRVLGAIFTEQGKTWPRKLIGEDAFKNYRDKWELARHPAEEAPSSLLPPWVLDGLVSHPQPDLRLV